MVEIFDDIKKLYTFAAPDAALTDYIKFFSETSLEVTHRVIGTTRFTIIVGTPPKNYLAITRARTALTAYVKDAPHFSPDRYGYYDRSHFYKDVVRFTGRKLSAYPG